MQTLGEIKERVQDYVAKFGALRSEIARVIVGQQEIVEGALLEAMQERQVTVGGTTYALDGVFFVLATQNPLEMEGTYPLPEAQLDRFIYKLVIDYPTRSDLIEVLRRTTAEDLPHAENILT